MPPGEAANAGAVTAGAKPTIEERATRLLNGLVWPALAGNFLWTLGQMVAMGYVWKAIAFVGAVSLWLVIEYWDFRDNDRHGVGQAVIEIAIACVLTLVCHVVLHALSPGGEVDNRDHARVLRAALCSLFLLLFLLTACLLCREVRGKWVPRASPARRGWMMLVHLVAGIVILGNADDTVANLVASTALPTCAVVLVIWIVIMIRYPRIITKSPDYWCPFGGSSRVR